MTLTLPTGELITGTPEEIKDFLMQMHPQFSYYSGSLNDQKKYTEIYPNPDGTGNPPITGTSISIS